ncbi:MAG: type III pantothenate kinase [Cyanobium sp.]
MLDAPRWLLIGNSRWHWGERLQDGQLRGWDGPPLPTGEAAPPPVAWAAVGPLPDPLLCPPGRRVAREDVPLLGCPPWLGVDRALAGWGAWQELGDSVLVVDAGTVLSLTRVDPSGTFQGGRLLAGLRLQCEAMTKRTRLIPAILSDAQPGHHLPEGRNEDALWPQATAAAMEVGVAAGLAAAVIEASRSAACRWVVLTGGDSAMLFARVAPELRHLGLEVAHRPLLCLESLASLRAGS